MNGETEFSLAALQARDVLDVHATLQAQIAKGWAFFHLLLLAFPLVFNNTEQRFVKQVYNEFSSGSDFSSERIRPRRTLTY